MLWMNHVFEAFFHSWDRQNHYPFCCRYLLFFIMIHNPEVIRPACFYSDAVTQIIQKNDMFEVADLPSSCLFAIHSLCERLNGIRIMHHSGINCHNRCERLAQIQFELSWWFLMHVVYMITAVNAQWELFFCWPSSMILCLFVHKLTSYRLQTWEHWYQTC